MPFVGLSDSHLDALTYEGLRWLIGAQNFFSLIQNNFGVSFRVTHQLLLAVWKSRLTVIEAHDPDELLGAQIMSVCLITIKDFGDITGSLFDLSGRYLLPPSSYSTRSRVKLRNIQNRELILLDEITRLLVVDFFLGWEPTNNISSKSHIRDVLGQIVTNFLEFFHGVFSDHFVEDFV